jgi:hypothetical protein
MIKGINNAQVALRNWNSTLEKAVSEKTRELTHVIEKLN